jgi:hypothetical protein
MAVGSRSRSLPSSIVEADPMSSDILAPSRGARSCLVPVGVCLAFSAGIAALLIPAVQKARDAARMAQLT